MQGGSPPPPRHRRASCLAIRDLILSTFRTAQAQVALRAKNVAVEIGDPLSPVGRYIEVADRAVDLRRYVAPVELRIEFDQISRRRITELLVHPDLIELAIKCIGLAQIMRIAKLTDEIGGANQDAIFAGSNARRKPRGLYGSGDAVGVKQLDLGDAIHHEQLRAVDVIRHGGGVGTAARQGGPAAPG